MSTIKIKNKLKDGRCTARILIKHPMDVGGRGRKPHFIKEVQCTHNGRIVMTAHWGAGISKNPYLSFIFSGAAKGDTFVLSWHDNKDKSDRIEVTL